MTSKFELQVLRDFKAFSRPHILVCAWPDIDSEMFVLRPGWDSDAASTHILVNLMYSGLLAHDWLGLKVALFIDNNPIRTPQPCAFWMHPSDIPSGIAHIMPVAEPGSGLGGWFTVTLRTVA